MKSNPKLSPGDKIILLHMEDETMSPGLKGVVISVSNVFGEDIYDVEWENGRKLNLLSDVDKWKKSKIRVDEGGIDKFIMNNLNFIKAFDRKFFIEYLKNLRDSGVINMFGASPYLYVGKERIEHEFKYKEFINEESEEAFQKVLENADMAQSKMIQGVMKILEKEGKEITLDSINSGLKKYSILVLQYYIHLLSTP